MKESPGEIRGFFLLKIVDVQELTQFTSTSGGSFKKEKGPSWALFLEEENEGKKLG